MKNENKPKWCGIVGQVNESWVSGSEEAHICVAPFSKIIQNEIKDESEKTPKILNVQIGWTSKLLKGPQNQH